MKENLLDIKWTDKKGGHDSILPKMYLKNKKEFYFTNVIFIVTKLT